ncbi:MAG TPA: TonB-dependent receptor [Thermoanaerobaculia bacterium]|nr:TonB-dependent receptor [Thermoanaerobaculia bacterium]
MSLRRIGTAVLFVAGIASAQEQPKPETTEETKMTEVIVVTASRTEQRIDEVPAAVTVITSEEIEQLPVHDYGDILRSVPGVNVTQMSAREMQVTARSATSSLATSQLVLLDRRSVYLDFFGFVMWDFLPVDLAEIKQVEVVRGPASAVWGANAMTGVINLITKAPRDMVGTSVTVGAGEIGTMFSNLTHAGAADRYGYKVTAGYYEQDAFERPTGLIPETHTLYPAFENEGTSQPKVDLRFDYDTSPNSVLSLSSGYAGTDGLVHSGIGPFDLNQGSAMSYAKADWTRGALQATAFVNALDADSTNLLAIGADGKPISFAFETKTYNVDVTNTTVLRNRHVLTYGATARQNDFDLSIAPRGDQRNEYGAFLQDEVLFGKARWVLGARWDDLDPIGSVVSPRTALLYSPAQDHTIRFSFSRAFRAPSVINTDLDTAILNEIALPTGSYVFGTRAGGNASLTEERMDAYEIGYVGRLRGHATLAVSIYRNETKDLIDFYASSYYTAANPPARWPLPPFYLDAPPLRNALPSSFSYRNIGSVTNSGVEVALNARPSTDWSWFINYSYSADPEAEGVDVNEINAPPSDRVNAGAAWDHGRFFVNTTVHYQSRAEWRDVLDARYWGPTDSFTSINAGAGVRMTDNITVSLTGTNLTNERIQQHVFGDIISRKVIAQLRFRYP